MNITEQLSQSLQVPATSISRRIPELRVSICQECGTPVPVELVDMARMDLLFLTDRPLRFGTVLQTAIFCDLVTGVSYSKALVHFCRPTLRGWQIGAFLATPISDFLFSRFMDELRGQLRYECDWKAWVLWDSSGQLDPAKIVSYSINGMRLMLERPVEAGGEFSIFSSSGARQQPILSGRVRWCRPVDGGYAAGCMVHGQRGRELPKMFGNLTALHIQPMAPLGPQLSGETSDILFSHSFEPERFLPTTAAQRILSRRDHQVPAGDHRRNQ